MPSDASGAGRDHRCPTVWATALLAVHNVVAWLLPARTYIPVNAGLAAVLVAVGRRGGLSWGDLGLDPGGLRRAWRVGGPAAAAAAGVMAVGAVGPRTRVLFDDARVDVQRGPAALLYETLVRIPAGTVALEEIAFRGVLLASLRRQTSTPAAVALSSGLFGLWHITPTLRMASANGITGARRLGLVTGSVAVTAVGGVMFCGARLLGGQLLAPALVHVAINDAGFALAWSVRSWGPPERLTT